MVETDNIADLHRLTSAFAVFQFRIEPVDDVMDAIAVEASAIEWRSLV